MTGQGEDAGGVPAVVATYAEIAARFGLRNTDHARITAKRRRWPLEPRNHPGNVARVRVPGDLWDAAGQRRPDPSDLPDPSDPPDLPQSVPAPLSADNLFAWQALCTLTGQLEQAAGRADRAEAARAAAEARAAQAELAAAVLTEQLAQARTSADRLRRLLEGRTLTRSVARAWRRFCL